MRLSRTSLLLLLIGAVTAESGSAQVSETRKLQGTGTLELGLSVALDGDTVAAFGEGSGNPVFERDLGGVNWDQVATLSDGEHTVAIDGDTMLVGSAGRVWVLGRDQEGEESWGVVTELTPSDGEPTDRLGASLDVSGDTAVVGAPRDDDNGNRSGSAYVFERSGPGSWIETGKLLPLDGELEDEFGRAVRIDGDRIVASAFAHAQHGGGPSRRGALYFFERDAGGPGAWGQVAETQLGPGSGTRLAEEHPFLALEGDFAVAATRDAEVYVFERDQASPGAWGLALELAPSADFPDVLSLRRGVAIDSQRIAVGADLAVGVNRVTGSVSIFEMGAGGASDWSQTMVLASSDDSGELIGEAVAISARTVAAGAPTPSGRGDDDDDMGAIFVFDLPEPGPVGGRVRGIDPTHVTCRNLSRGTGFLAQLTGESWDCETLGLTVESGDRVWMRVFGHANGSEPVGGTTTGQVTRNLTCINRTTGGKVSVPIGGGGIWDCQGEGLVLVIGDEISQVVRGTKL